MKIKPTAVPDKCVVTERRFKDDSKIFGLNNWKGRVAINYNGRGKVLGRFGREDKESSF